MLPVVLAASLLLGGCLELGLLLGGAAATLVIKEGFIDEDTYGGEVKTTPGKAFSAATEVLDELCHKIDLDKAFRRVSGSWQSSDVEVTVEDIRGGEVSIVVKARKYGILADKDTAVEVFQMILVKIEG
ncbi:MAG: hypothetical protein ACYTG7_02560 [Planctomycetota bacterium]|jgi:hypothetical protein